MKINVISKFTLVMSDCVPHEFDVGEHEVDQDIADHWYVKANCEAAEVVEPEVIEPVKAKIKK